MNFLKLFAVLFSLSHVFDMCADRLYYRSDLYALLLAQGLEPFLDSCKKRSNSAFQDALKDVVELTEAKYANSLMKSIHEGLQARIRKIDAVRGKKFDWKSLILGAGATGLGSVGLLASICKMWIDMSDRSRKNDYWASGSFHMPIYTGKDIVFIDWRDKEAFMVMWISLISLVYGVSTFNAGLSLHNDDVYFEKYKSLLRIIAQARKRYGA